MLNKITIMGRIARDLELKNTPNGIAVTSFAIATDRNYKENGEYPTDFFEIVAWRKTAEFICKYFAKGRMIVIDGTLQSRTYTDKDGVNRKVVEILVDSAFFCEQKSNNGNANSNASVNTANSYTNTGYNSENEFNGMPDDFNPFPG